MKGNFPYSSFYDKLNARDRCDDLVLLEEVSIEGIVEVRIRWAVTCRALIGAHMF